MDLLLPMQLNITRSITEALTFSLRHAVPFYLLGLVTGLPTYLHSFLPQETRTLDLPGGGREAVLPRPWWETDLAVPAIEAVLLGMMVAIMVHTLQRDRRGESRTVLPSLAEAAPCLPTVIAVSLTIRLVGTLVGAGGVFLGKFIGSVAGLILFFPLLALLFVLYFVFCVAIPCAAADNAGVINAFRRSAALTAGSRGRLFGLFVVVLLPLVAATAAVVILSRGEIFSGGFPTLWLWLVGAALVVYFNALIAVIHEALVALKEGAGAGTLATVFD